MATKKTKVELSAETSKYEKSMRNVRLENKKTTQTIKKHWMAVSAVMGAVGISFAKIFKDGFNAVENMRLSAASLASTITSFARDAETDLAGTYKQAYDYSTQLVLKMEEWNAKTVATGVNLTAMVETLAQGGIVLDLNNKRQEKSFLAIANALALITQGQNQDIQFRQEIRGLVQGEVRATNLLARLLQQRIGGSLKEHVTLWKEQGTLIENAGALLEGFQEGAKDLQNTWLAVGTTLETVYNKVLRGMFIPVYEDIIKMGRQITLSVMNQDSQSEALAGTLKGTLYKGWQDIKNITESAVDIIVAFKGPLLLVGKITGMIFDGWGQIFSILPAITNRLKLITQAIFDSVKMVYHFGETLWHLTSLQFKAAAESWEKTKADWKESGRKTAEAFSSGFGNELETRLLKYNKDLTVAAKVSIEAPEMKELSGPTDKQIAEMKAQYAQYYKELEALAQEKMDFMSELEDEETRMFRENLEYRLELKQQYYSNIEEKAREARDLEEEMENEKMRMARETAAYQKRITEDEAKTRLSFYQSMAGGISGIFSQIAQVGGKQSEEAFRMYQAFAIIEATIAANLAAAKVVGQLGIFGIPLSAMVWGMAMANVAMIAAAQPPSYDEGGISRAAGVYQTGSIAEAHVPLKGGAIPVNLSGASQKPTIIIHMENPVFQDLDTQRQVFAQIADVVARQVAPGAVIENYNDDLGIRQMVRGGT